MGKRQRARISTLLRAGVIAAAAGPAVMPAAATAGVANDGLTGASRTNPLVGVPWGVYRGRLDGLYPAFQSARGANRGLLAQEALRPSVHWMGAWDTDSTAGQVARQIIAASGGPNVLSEIAVFRLDPWEGAACTQLPDRVQQSSYRDWVGNFARGVGSARMLIILQPDLPFAMCQPDHSLASLNLVAQAAQVLDGLPHTTVYIDAGAADYLSVNDALQILEHAGIQYARGFSLNTTHSDSTARQILYAQRLSRALARRGFAGKHAVINTAQNGKPFTQWFYQHQGLRSPVCASRRSRMCLTLGIPPTTDVANPRWGLSPGLRAIAARLVDAYVWTSRPWLDNGSYPFDEGRALQLARTTPF